MITIGALINNKKIYQNVNAGASAFQENMEALKQGRKRSYDTASMGLHGPSLVHEHNDWRIMRTLMCDTAGISW